MGRTSSTVKDRYNAKAYDQTVVRLPKGMKAQLQAACEKAGISMNSVFSDAAKKFIEENPPD